MVYLAEEGSGLAATLAAGSAADGPVLLTNGHGDPFPVLQQIIQQLDPGAVIALGAAHSGVSDAMLQELAQGRPTDRIPGTTPYEVAASVASRAWPEGAARSTWPKPRSWPTVLPAEPCRVESCNGIHPATAAEIERLDSLRISALGGTSAICDTTLEQTHDL